MIRKLETFIAYIKIDGNNDKISILDQAKEKVEQELIRSNQHVDTSIQSVEFAEPYYIEKDVLVTYKDYFVFKVHILKRIPRF
jgi:hypothetical protein